MRYILFVYGFVCLFFFKQKTSYESSRRLETTESCFLFSSRGGQARSSTVSRDGRGVKASGCVLGAGRQRRAHMALTRFPFCLLYTSVAAHEQRGGDLGGCRAI